MFASGPCVPAAINWQVIHLKYNVLSTESCEFTSAKLSYIRFVEPGWHRI
eukprot:COSAG05_NODE_2198_length_3410_cov_5.345213_2_plen_50_part_00